MRVTAGSAAINGWTVTWTFANGQTVTQAWNATVTSSGSAVTARNVSYNGNLGAGAQHDLRIPRLLERHQHRSRADLHRELTE